MMRFVLVLTPLLTGTFGLPFYNSESMPSKYHSYEEMTTVLKIIQKEHSEVSRLYSIGRTFRGKKYI